MAVWKDTDHPEVPTEQWFATLLTKSGFEPEALAKQGQTYVAQAGGFMFRLGREHLEAAGTLTTGVRVALLKRNAHALTDLYDDGLTVIFKSPNAIRAFRNLLDQGETLTEALRIRMAKAYARGEHETRRRRPHPQNEDLHLVPVRSIA